MEANHEIYEKELVKACLVDLCFKSCDFVEQMGSDRRVSEMVDDYLASSTKNKRVRRRVMMFFSARSPYNEEDVVLWDWLFHYPFLEKTAWKRLESNLVEYFGSGRYKIEVEPAVLFMKKTIQHLAPFSELENGVSVNGSYGEERVLMSRQLVDFSIVAKYCRYIVEKVTSDAKYEGGVDESTRKELKKSQRELNEKEFKFLETLIEVLLGNLQFKKRESTEEKVKKFIGQWKGSLDVIKLTYSSRKNE